MCVVGRLVPHKQVEHAIDAVVELRKEIAGLTLTVVGSGWWEHVLQEYAAVHDPDGAVRFLGQVDEREKEQVYEESWVLALPSLKEGWGLVVGEAALAGTPTVAYASAGGTRESVQDGRTGLLVDDRDGFVDALRRLLTDDALRERLGEGARVNGGSLHVGADARRVRGRRDESAGRAAGLGGLSRRGGPGQARTLTGWCRRGWRR